ncbi:unnamed protein product [Bursaphelenchus xylophilus]|uniref:(pine wood nematode) hypothetical protein n=1 Tax=Bursaphelenchus xylophilus TaxID=6326 RepID=A0A1I7S371_BURXY|nr:unnamed protein product [Bursaphelenchus xylophilus]CAG9116117.1 unnamed protein product [Bursaphelenchus xylophilus]
MPRLRRDRYDGNNRVLDPKDQPCCSSSVLETEERLIEDSVEDLHDNQAPYFTSNLLPQTLQQPYKTRNLKRILLMIGGLAVLGLIGGLINFGDSSFEKRHSLYSGINEDQGETWYLNSHEIRRRRDLSPEEDEEDPNLKGLSLECNQKCTLTLHRQSQVLRINLFRKEFNSIQKEEKVIPIIQYLESENETQANPTLLSPACIYSARVEEGQEESIVNLCEPNGGLFGTLSLSDGAYVIEPLSVDGKTRKKRDLKIKPHLIYKAKNIPFEEPLDSEGPGKTDEDQLFLNSSKNGNRNKRAANSWDYYVEVLVVADYKMLVYHQNNLESYVLTLFSTVASIYRHASLRASVNIIVVRVVVLKHENVGPRVSNHAQETLQQFCAWQQNLNDRNDDALAHHDVAILLTRHDICRATNKCDTLGLAELGTMCDARKSCAIIEDNGLSAAFTIAHELGHILNIPHDDERRCGRYMPLTKNNYHIMAPTLEYNTNPWAWSPCSSAMLERFLDNQRSQTQCILDKPIERRYMDKMFNHPPAGMLYSVNQQCQFVFGPSAEICPYMPTCRRLWCSTYYGFQMGCRTQHMPWADGTPCGDSMWCHRGQCVGISPNKRLKVDGGWGEWQIFGSCSRTCGGGVQKGVRDCDKPRPMNGGKYCVGQRERYRSCNIQECPFETAGFRETQCSEFDNKNVGIHGVPITTKWVPKYTGIAKNERCKLYCRAKDSAAFYLLKDKVIDGTPCDRNSDDICIDGICHKAGCDHRLGSDIKRDTCGVCGGDGSTCQTVQGVYNEKTSFGYNEVLRIPAGSANIDISQLSYNNHKDDDNYLALRTATGEFLLNGQYQVSVFRQQIPILDTVLEYSGSDNIVERINGSGPLRSDIYVHVLSVGNLNPPHVNYKYMVPRNPGRLNTVSRSSQYYWIIADDWSQCSSRCQGSQVQGLKCMEAASNRPVADQYCTSKRPEQKQRMCNVNCFFKWKTTHSSACSARCGKGEQNQDVACVTLTKQPNNLEKEEPAHEQECVSVGLSKPPSRIPCYNDCDGRMWTYSAWTPCSATCGNDGISRRQVTCTDSANRSIDPRFCDQIPKESTETECNRLPCPGWIYGQWTECSRSCDGGIRVRHSSCADSSGREIPVENCASQERKDREKCNEHVCSKWKYGMWSSCSTTCGNGIQKRDATCVDRNGKQLDDNKCDVREKILQKSCHQGDCPHWKIGSWSTCSVSCLDGYKTRSVQCVDGNESRISEDYCLKTSNNSRPSTHELCNNGPCPYWRLNPWSPCSASCGSGIRSRTVECVFKEQVVDASFCSEQPPKQQQQNCTLLPCSEWRTHPWSRCSKSCGSGMQSRKVECTRDGNVVNNNECSGTKPRTEKACNREECEPPNVQPNESPIYWATGPWTECSKYCGNGTQRRQVKCRDSRSRQELPDEYCRNFEKEPESRTCNLRPCVEWRSGEWSSCQGSCGAHVVQKRHVYCFSTENPPVQVTDADCDPTDQPASIKGCNFPPCPAEAKTTLGEWKTGPWLACSVSCGIGYRRRTVQCDSKICNESTKPSQFEHCNLGECRQKHTWQAGQWSMCSITCGKGGLQQRRIWCESIVNPTKEVSAKECDLTDAPQSRRICHDLPECPINSAPQTTTQVNRSPKYVWTSGQWSMCSSSCGPGARVRDVYCVDALTQTTKMPPTLCDPAERPVAEHRCRQKTCPKWVKEKWSECSVTCGKGVRRREVFCRRGRDETLADSYCAEADRPENVRPCESQKCSSYEWKVTPWSKCVDLCKPNEQHRRAYCMSSLNQRAAPKMCSNDTIPILKRNCPSDKCPYNWVPGPWSTCSKTCGIGHQFRRLECKVKENMWLNQPERESTVLSRMCMALKKPEVSMECIMNSCDSEFRWSVGPWSKCSQECGPGSRKRKVYCLNTKNEKVEKEKCNEGHRPVKRENCFLRNCLPGDCAQLKSQNPNVNGVDGEYFVLVAGYRTKVYCHGMNETLPRTYLTVNPQMNYAEFYGKRLAYPFSCPYDGQRNDSCDCTDDGHLSVGRTEFGKVRVDLQNMKINPHDFTFAKTSHGSPVPYGTAGDCYSMSDCPQGRFSIDLRNTGLKIVDDLQWTDHGHRTSSHIERSMNNAVITGACGGYCGECAPERFKGLVLELEHKLKSKKH